MSVIADPGSVALFVTGLVLLAGGLGFLAIGLCKRSRSLRSARTYATREPAASDADRPVNPHHLPKSYGTLGPPT